MARRGENIYKRKDGRYEGRFVIGRTPEGRTRFGYVYARSYGSVRMQLIQKKALSPQGAEHRLACTYDEWALYWMERQVRPGVRVSTYANYQNILSHLVRGLGGIPIQSLTQARGQQFLDELRDKGLARSTREGILRMLKSSLRAAAEAGFISRSPCAGLRLERADRCEQRVLSLIEQTRVMRSGGLEMLAGLYLGLRVGEVCGLCWEDVNWQENTVAIRRTVQRCRVNGCTRLTTGVPKSATSVRTIPVPEFLMQLLKRRHAGVGVGFIFGDGGRMTDPRTLQRRLKRQTERMCIPEVHFHTLRHTFATRLMELDVDIKTVSALLGHSSARITLDCYAHSTLEQRRVAMRRLAACI